jgi:hypothetical protein
MAFQLAGQTLKGPFSAGETLYPANWLALSTPEERQNIGITETPDTPAAEDKQEPIRLAGDVELKQNSDTSDISNEANKQESGSSSDTEKNNFFESGSANEFEPFAGQRFAYSERGLTYSNKPTHGSALTYGQNRVEKPIVAPIQTAPVQTPPPAKPADATPSAGNSTGVTYKQPEAYKAEDNNNNEDYSEPDYKPNATVPFNDVVGAVPKDDEPKVEEKPAAPTPTAPAKTPETLSMSRFVDPSTGRHLYTSNVGEGNSAGFSSEGQAFQLFKDSGQTTGTSDVYRLFNPTTGDHFYTASAAEKNVAAGAGYNVEGSVGAAYTAPSEGSTAVDRYFQAATGQHFYTSDAKEAANLGSLGFQKEGVAFYTPNSSQTPGQTATESSNQASAPAAAAQSPAQQYWEATNSAPAAAADEEPKFNGYYDPDTNAYYNYTPYDN